MIYACIILCIEATFDEESEQISSWTTIPPIAHPWKNMCEVTTNIIMHTIMCEVECMHVAIAAQCALIEWLENRAVT